MHSSRRRSWLAGSDRVAVRDLTGAGKTTAMRTIANVLEPTRAGQALGVDSRRPGAVRATEDRGTLLGKPGLPDDLSGEEVRASATTGWHDASRRASQFRLPLARRLRHLSRGMRMKHRSSLASARASRCRRAVRRARPTGARGGDRRRVVLGAWMCSARTTWTRWERLADRVGISSAMALVEEVEVAARSRPSRPSWMLPAPTAPAESWSEVHRGRTLRFVESRFDPHRTAEDLSPVPLACRDPCGRSS